MLSPPYQNYLSTPFINKQLQPVTSNMNITHKQLPEEDTEPDTVQMPSLPTPLALKAKITSIQQTIRSWETKQSWTYSKEREQFFDQMFYLKELELSSLEKSISHNQTITETKADEPPRDSSLPQMISQSALKQQRQLMNSHLTIVHLRRSERQPLTVKEIEGARYYQVQNIIQAINLCLFDMFEAILKEPFTFYKYMVIEHDLSWINNNKTLPKKYQYMNEELFKRLVLDYYAMHSKYSTKEILELYDLDIVLEIYFRAVLKIKGQGTPGNLENFRQVPKWDELANYFAKHCISRFKCVRETKECVQLHVEITDKMFEIRLQNGKGYLKTF